MALFLLDLLALPCNSFLLIMNICNSKLQRHCTPLKLSKINRFKSLLVFLFLIHDNLQIQFDQFLIQVNTFLMKKQHILSQFSLIQYIFD
ncbi:unnamed protein product [Paramecium primaurelia]|uniref:Uncharacterized protein n=1 Tax=Paramecium primaurelia TaxID=5886 RepID=A0A8S1NRH1_PARPR|nr:unnamed protein product [Paramecium primaurelia]